jgi:hypothetical protein
MLFQGRVDPARTSCNNEGMMGAAGDVDADEWTSSDDNNENSEDEK